MSCVKNIRMFDTTCLRARLPSRTGSGCGQRPLNRPHLGNAKPFASRRSCFNHGLEASPFHEDRGATPYSLKLKSRLVSLAKLSSLVLARLVFSRLPRHTYRQVLGGRDWAREPSALGPLHSWHTKMTSNLQILYATIKIEKSLLHLVLR
jgi:hypothetical protein